MSILIEINSKIRTFPESTAPLFRHRFDLMLAAVRSSFTLLLSGTTLLLWLLLLACIGWSRILRRRSRAGIRVGLNLEDEVISIMNGRIYEWIGK